MILSQIQPEIRAQQLGGERPVMRATSPFREQSMIYSPPQSPINARTIPRQQVQTIRPQSPPQPIISSYVQDLRSTVNQQVQPQQQQYASQLVSSQPVKLVTSQLGQLPQQPQFVSSQQPIVLNQTSQLSQPQTLLNRYPSQAILPQQQTQQQSLPVTFSPYSVQNTSFINPTATRSVAPQSFISPVSQPQPFLHSAATTTLTATFPQSAQKPFNTNNNVYISQDQLTQLSAGGLQPQYQVLPSPQYQQIQEIQQSLPIYVSESFPQQRESKPYQQILPQVQPAYVQNENIYPNQQFQPYQQQQIPQLYSTLNTPIENFYEEQPSYSSSQRTSIPYGVLPASTINRQQSPPIGVFSSDEIDRKYYGYQGYEQQSQYPMPVRTTPPSRSTYNPPIGSANQYRSFENTSNRPAYTEPQNEYIEIADNLDPVAQRAIEERYRNIPIQRSKSIERQSVQRPPQQQQQQYFEQSRVRLPKPYANSIAFGDRYQLEDINRSYQSSGQMQQSNARGLLPLRGSNQNSAMNNNTFEGYDHLKERDIDYQFQKAPKDFLKDYLQAIVDMERNIESNKIKIVREEDYSVQLFYELFDQNESGQITIAETITGLKKLGIDAEQSDVRLLISRYSSNGSNSLLNQQEFINMIIPRTYKHIDAIFTRKPYVTEMNMKENTRQLMNKIMKSLLNAEVVLQQIRLAIEAQKIDLRQLYNLIVQNSAEPVNKDVLREYLISQGVFVNREEIILTIQRFDLKDMGFFREQEFIQELRPKLF